ncbi:MAG: diphthamide synthesis protein [Candidatus Woesearchaeota archaeon]
MDIRYELELERAVEEIKKSDARLVCIQLPDGLKPIASEIAKRLEKETGAKILIWLGSCFGACDTPIAPVASSGVDLLIQWGHSPWVHASCQKGLEEWQRKGIPGIAKLKS